MAKLSLAEIEEVTRAALVAHGAEGWIAGEVARAVREAESHGNRICGLYYLESYCRQLRSGRVKGDVEPEVSRPRPGAVVVDARLGFAQPAFSRGLPEAVTAARENGVASLAICHAHTCTALGFFTEQIARQGLIALGMTNASPIVAPPGGKTRVIGTNPISFAVPDGEGGIAMLFDQSTTTVALGKITMAKAAGEAIPEGWAVDAEGNPTTDPEAALGGSLVSMGGYKGWGFGLMAELLAAGMTGSRAAPDIAPLKAPEGEPHDIGDYYLLIDPGMSGAFHDRFARIAGMVAMDEGARIPGAGRQGADPVEVDNAAWHQAKALAGR
ncbi:MAG: Ldh family oxidoreductase [Roseovarius sp.]|uniref:Ldh family oxidoreductase n=1 Tax=Roseovarius sp. TaxID=1486281 RepID=UPI0032EF8B96